MNRAARRRAKRAAKKKRPSRSDHKPQQMIRYLNRDFSYTTGRPRGIQLAVVDGYLSPQHTANLLNGCEVRDVRLGHTISFANVMDYIWRVENSLTPSEFADLAKKRGVPEKAIQDIVQPKHTEFLVIHLLGKAEAPETMDFLDVVAAYKRILDKKA